jgi:hypothetical protein
VSTFVHIDPLIQRMPDPAHRDQADFALRCVLDAEIEALNARLEQGSENVAAVCGLARADLDRAGDWLRDSVTKLQDRRNSLG